MKRILLLQLALLLTSCIGCQGTQDESPTAEETTGQADSHAGHDHGETGPHGGHLLHLEPLGAHAEWTHDDDNHLVTVYLDDFDVANIVEAKFVAKIGETVEEFPLSASDKGWSVTSETLMTHINMGEAAVVSLVVIDDRGEQKAQVEAHDHHH